jgi:outer membrane protein assembly factor BamB
MKRWPLLTVAIVSVALSPLSAADWPQFRHDAGHTAASTASLPEELHLAWTKVFAPPKPAFPNEVRLRYDASYEPVVMDKTMFVPSMVTDTVTALDTETGAERWRFFTDGPVRFAPVAWKDKVYFVSDDTFRFRLVPSAPCGIASVRGL